MTLPRLSEHTAPLLAVSAAAVLLPTLLTGCDNGCEQTRENYVQATFVSTSGRTMRGMGITCLKGDKIIQNRPVTNADRVEIDINPNDSVTTLFVQCTYTDYGDSFSSIDTVNIAYTSNARFLDLSCGCTIDYDLTDIQTTHNLLSKAVITDSAVRPDGGINITFEY